MIKLFQTKPDQFSLKKQFVPRSKHFLSLLKQPTNYCFIWQNKFFFSETDTKHKRTLSAGRSAAL
jgi:hypothetical protein